MTRLVVDEAANTDIRDAARWYENRRKGLAADFVRELDHTLSAIARRPQSFPIVVRTARRALLRRFPYLVLFVESGQGIGVIGVFHTARNPAVRARRLGRRGE